MAKRWDRSGVLLEVGDYDQYKVKVDGSGRVSTRNRRFLRKVQPYQPRQPAQRAQTQLDPVEGVRQTGGQPVVVERAGDKEIGQEQEQTMRVMDTVARDAEMEQRDTVEVMEPQVETAGAVVEEQAPMQEARRLGRVRKTNVKYDSETWDLNRD